MYPYNMLRCGPTHTCSVLEMSKPIALARVSTSGVRLSNGIDGSMPCWEGSSMGLALAFKHGSAIVLACLLGLLLLCAGSYGA